MLDLIRKFFPDTLLTAMVMKAVRWLAASASAAIAAWLLSFMMKHGISADGALGGAIQNIAGAAGTIITGLGALAFELWDAKKVDTQVKALTPPAQAQIDQAQADKTQTAMDQAKAAGPKTIDDVIAADKVGTF